MEMFDLLRSGDIPAADELRALAGWNQTRGDWASLLALAPAGCFAARAGGRLVGTVTVTPYGADLAWIGMVLVHPEHRRRGIAAALLERALAWLEARGTRVVALDASEAGEPLYRKRGFEPRSTLERWVLDGPPTERAATRAAAAKETTIRGGDWHGVAALDRESFGADRRDALRSFAGRARASSIERRCGIVEGFGLLRAGTFADALAPIIGRSSEVAARLVDRLLAYAGERPVIWDIPDDSSEAVLLARRLGFVPKRRFTRMTLGGTLGGIPRQVWGILDPATG